MAFRPVTEPVAVGLARESTVLDALALLVPSDLMGETKARFGAPGDGSYVLVNRCRPTQNVISFGIGPSVSFDLAMAERGHRIFLFDHTIDVLPAQHARFIWIKQGICAVSEQDPALDTLEAHLARLDLGSDDPILKIDVEGAEWGIFAYMPVAVLQRFEQITFEAHFLNKLEEPHFNALVQRALGNLAAQFTLCHVHANNFGGIHMLGSLPVPETLELTYIRSDVVRSVPSATFYPTTYDAPNCPHWPELRLWFYPFVPGSENMRPLA
jgi:hypothetical protein